LHSPRSQRDRTRREDRHLRSSTRYGTTSRNAGALREGSLDLKQGDATRLPWPDGSFDLVLSANTFFFIADPAPVLTEIRRVLVPDGSVVIGTVPGPLPQASIRNWWVYVWGSRMHVYDEKTVRTMLEHAGFHDISITRIDDGEPLQLILASS